MDKTFEYGSTHQIRIESFRGDMVDFINGFNKTYEQIEDPHDVRLWFKESTQRGIEMCWTFKGGKQKEVPSDS